MKINEVQLSRARELAYAVLGAVQELESMNVHHSWSAQDVERRMDEVNSSFDDANDRAWGALADFREESVDK